MTRIVADISVSLDGFVTGPDLGPDNGLFDTSMSPDDLMTAAYRTPDRAFR